MQRKAYLINKFDENALRSTYNYINAYRMMEFTQNRTKMN